MPSAQHMSAIKPRKLRTAATNTAIRSIIIERNWFDNGEELSSAAIRRGQPRQARDTIAITLNSKTLTRQEPG